MSYTAEIFGSSIVLVGQFNPAIFTADWLERNSLIGSEDAEYARASTNVLVSHAVAVCETEWFALQVLENQFSLTSKGALSHAFRDLAEGIATLVPHTPVTALGLNFMGHYKMSTEAGYHKVGDVLVPKKLWGELFDPETEKPGMADVTVKIQQMRVGETIASSPDELRINVQPSATVKWGVFLSCNAHRESFGKVKGKANAAGAAELMGVEWEKTWHRAESIFDGILTKATAG